MIRTAAPLLLALLPLGAFAATPIDQTHPLSADARVQIENIKGRISVSSWERQEVHIGGSLGEGVEELLVRGDADALLIRVEYPESGGWFGWGNGGGAESTLEIKVPRRVALEIEAVSADIDVTGTEGKQLAIESVSGDVRVDAAADEASVETVSGDQDVRIATRALDVETVSGEVRVHGPVSGRVQAEAVSGALRIEAEALEDLQGSTVSGDIRVNGTLAGAGRIRLEALSGDVRVELASMPSARIEASSFSGSIRSDIGEVERSEHGPGSHLEARAGDGAGRIALETFSGDIELRTRGN